MEAADAMPPRVKSTIIVFFICLVISYSLLGLKLHDICLRLPCALEWLGSATRARVVYRISNAKLHLTIKTTLRYLQGKKPLPVKSAPAKNECSKKRRPHHKGSALYKSFRFVAVSYLRRLLVTPQL